MTMTMILDQLRAAPMPLSAANSAPDAGFCALWAPPGVLPGVPPNPHPIDPSWHLLYVGIAPLNATSRATLRSRISDHLLGGRVDDSTFRYSLAALLKDIYDFRPLAMGNGGELTPTHNAQLTAWQDGHLRRLVLGAAGEG